MLRNPFPGPGFVEGLEYHTDDEFADDESTHDVDSVVDADQDGGERNCHEGPEEETGQAWLHQTGRAIEEPWACHMKRRAGVPVGGTLVVEKHEFPKPAVGSE